MEDRTSGNFNHGCIKSGRGLPQSRTLREQPAPVAISAGSGIAPAFLWQFQQCPNLTERRALLCVLATFLARAEQCSALHPRKPGHCGNFPLLDVCGC
jgi:hypothetical protein